MRWEYRTILFEFAKDGLLGDKYIDDVEVESTLNEQGTEGWEVVSVTMLRDGLLAILKRAGETAAGYAVPASTRVAQPTPPVLDEEEPADEPLTAHQLQEQEAEHIRQLERQRREAMQRQDDDLIGDIKIL